MRKLLAFFGVGSFILALAALVLGAALSLITSLLTFCVVSFLGLLGINAALEKWSKNSNGRDDTP